MVFMQSGTQISVLTGVVVGWAVAFCVPVLQFGPVVSSGVGGFGVWVASQLLAAGVRIVKSAKEAVWKIRFDLCLSALICAFCGDFLTIPNTEHRIHRIKTQKNDFLDTLVSVRDDRRPQRSPGENRDQIVSGLSLAIEASRSGLWRHLFALGSWDGASQLSLALAASAGGETRLTPSRSHPSSVGYARLRSVGLCDLAVGKRVSTLPSQSAIHRSLKTHQLRVSTQK